MNELPQLETDACDAVIGTVIDGRFRIDDVLGRGGMGSVYLAHHLKLDKPVALKLMHGSLFLDKQLLERFGREVKSCAVLKHPNIVKILSTGLSSEGQPYVAMDYVQGETLSKRLSESGRLKPDEARALFFQIASALACAHVSGVAHRDVKPSNVMLTQDSGGATTALVVDFGLSKFICDANGYALPQAQTATTMQGSPPYMSPEQCQNQKTDFRTDVYSLGCLMYEVLAGEPPFNGDSAFALMYEHVNSAPPPFDPSLAVPYALQNVIFRCLEKLPENRYATADDIVAALESGDSDAVLPNYGSRLKTKPDKSGRARRRPISVLLAVATVALLLVPFLFIWQVKMVPDDKTARGIALMLDKLGLFQLEVQFDTKYAERNLAESGFNPTAISRFDPRYSKVATYSQFTVDAVRAAAKADPDGQAEFATQSYLKLRQLVRGDEHGGIWLPRDDYHRVLRDNVAAMKLIPNIESSYTGIVGPEGVGLGQQLDQEAMYDDAEWVLLRSLDIIKRTNRENWTALNGVTFWLADNYLRRAVANGRNRADLERALLFFDQCSDCRNMRDELPQYKGTLSAHKATILRMLNRPREAEAQDELSKLAYKAIDFASGESEAEKLEARKYYWGEVLRILNYEGDARRSADVTAKFKLAEQNLADALKIDPHALND